MKKKLDIGLGLSDAFQHLIKSKERFMINFLLAVGLGLLFAGFVYFSVSGKVTEVSNYEDLPMLDTFFSDMFKMIPLFIFVLLIYVGIQGVFIKITDDVIEKRELTYGEQFAFVFKRLGKIILANVLAAIPLIVIYLIMIGAVISFMYTALTPIFLMTIMMMIYSMMLIFIDQSILVEDVSAFQAVKNSIAVVSHNFFRLVFTYLALGIFTFIVGSILSGSGFVIEILNLVISVIISLYTVVFATTLYKQTTPTEEKEIELEYFEDYE